MRPWISSASATPSSTPSGIGKRSPRVPPRTPRSRLRASATTRRRGRVPPPRRRGSAAARTREVEFSRWCVSAKFMPGARRVDQHLALAGLRLRQSTTCSTSGPPNSSICIARMDRNSLCLPLASRTACRSRSSDRSRLTRSTTPFGERERALGGSAVHFSLAASFFTEVRPVGPVGDDFGEAEYDVLRRHGVVTDDIEHVGGRRGPSSGAGSTSGDLNTAHTLDTQLNVFADFKPKLPGRSPTADLLFLGNIHPALQLDVLAQCDPPSSPRRHDELLDRRKPRSTPPPSSMSIRFCRSGS